MLPIWKDISVTKKLYALVGTMALLITVELLTLSFAMSTLSAVRGFVHGEGLWSKAQKDSVHSLYEYAVTKDTKHYNDFHAFMKIPLGDRQARLELEKPNPNFEIARQGFLAGGIHPHDIDGIINLLVRFHDISYISEAVRVWTDGDILIDELIKAAEELHQHIGYGGNNSAAIRVSLDKIRTLNDQMTKLENNFSSVMGAGSRWLEGLLMVVVLLFVLTVEGMGLLLTVSFGRNLNRSLKELGDTAVKVGQGYFDVAAPVRSNDELGQLAQALNQMIAALKKNIGDRQVAESANQVKTFFLANMSHEIRTPLGVILGLAEILRDPSTSESERQRYLEIIDRTGKNLNRIINDILDISKVEAGYLEIEKSKFSFPMFINELYFMLKVRAQKQNNKVVFVSKGEIPSEVFTDRTRLRQILINIIGNALKFTENGTVTMTYWVSSTHLHFDIEDTGIGISKEQAEKLFKPFAQVDITSSRKYEGTGLGLILSRRLAQILEGDVVLKESRVGKGSIFSVTVKFEIGKEEITPVKESVKASHEVGQLKNKKVLLVEDSIDNQLLIAVFLKRWGIEVEFANNGQEGVKKALNNNYDLILMDMQMPVLDGYSATRVLRAEKYAKPIIALTAHAMKEDRNRCLKAGCDEYLSKPIESNMLFETLNQFLTQPYRPRTEPSEGNPEVTV